MSVDAVAVESPVVVVVVVDMSSLVDVDVTEDETDDEDADEEELAAFLAKPKSYMKGTKMSFAGFKKQDDIDAVIAYLNSFPAN